MFEQMVLRYRQMYSLPHRIATRQARDEPLCCGDPVPVLDALVVAFWLSKQNFVPVMTRSL